MDVFGELKERMACHSNINEKKVLTDSIASKGIRQLEFRDYLMQMGTILEFDEKVGVFVATIDSGIINKNPAIVGAMLKDNMLYIAAYAKEGIIKQKTAEKAIQNIVSIVD